MLLCQNFHKSQHVGIEDYGSCCTLDRICFDSFTV